MAGSNGGAGNWEYAPVYSIANWNACAKKLQISKNCRKPSARGRSGGELQIGHWPLQIGHCSPIPVPNLQ